MTLVGHLLRAELKHVRFAVAAWLSIVVANAVIEGARPLAALQPELREAAAVIGSVLWLSQLLMSVVLVSLIVHAHPAVGTDAFWMTRSIPPQKLLASKLLLLVGALVGVPAIAEAVLMTAYGVAAREGTGVVAHGIERRLVLAALLIVAATLTRDLARFALLCGAVLVTVALGIGITIAVLMARLSEGPPFGTPDAGNGPTGQFVFNVLLIGAALVTATVQYGTRLRRRSVGVGVAGLAAAVAVSWVWPVPFLAPVLLVPPWSQQGGALAVTVDAATISTNTAHAFFPGRTLWSTVNGHVEVDGLPPGWSASIAVRDATVQLPGGELLRSAPGPRHTMLSFTLGSMVPHSVIRDVLGVKTLAAAVPPPPPPRPEGYPVLFVARRDDVTKRGPAHGEYRSVVSVGLTHYAVHGVLPVRPGARHRSGGYGLVIDSVALRDGDVTIAAREWRASSFWDRRPRATHSFYLRNRVRAEALSVSDVAMLGAFTVARLVPFLGLGSVSASDDGFVTRALLLAVPPRYDAQANTLVADDAWLADAELVIVRTTQEGSAERMLHLPSFPLGNQLTSTLPGRR
jgi:hypothetical protein